MENIANIKRFTTVIHAPVGTASKTMVSKNPRQKLINEIAKEFNPTSKNPILEFSVKNAFDFIEMITIRCEKLLDSISLPVVKSCDVSVVFGVTKFIVVVKDNKIVSKSGQNLERSGW